MITKGLNQPVQGIGGGWVEDDVAHEEAPQQAPTGFVETLPGKTKRKPRAVRDVVKIGWASERVNRRTKRV